MMVHCRTKEMPWCVAHGRQRCAGCPQVLEILARSALALSETKSGANTLALMLALEPPGAECAARHHACSS